MQGRFSLGIPPGSLLTFVPQWNTADTQEATGEGRRRAARGEATEEVTSARIARVLVFLQCNMKAVVV